MTGPSISFNNGFGLVECVPGSSYLMSYTDTQQKEGRGIQIINQSESDLVSLATSLNYLIKKNNEIVAYHRIFGEHNKPIGTYVGNGSTETRTINIGGMGSTLRIVGYACFGFCTSNGSLFMNSAGELVTTKHVKYESGILTMDTDYHYVNNNGTTYYYEVL